MADQETKKVLETSKYRMSLLERCRWSVRDKGRNKDLITRLKRCNDDLHRLCHFEALAQMNRALPAFVLGQYKNFMDLYKVADIVDQSAQDQTSPIAAGRERLAAMARFKARLLTPSKVADKYRAHWRLLDQGDYEVRSRSHSYSMGTSLRSRDPVFVEWQSYRGEDNRPSKAAEEQIHKLGDFLSVPHQPHEFRGLDCIGLFKDTANDRYGVVYNLPAYLRHLPHPTESQSRHIYNPSTLTDLINHVQAVADLGDRFDLAKKLIRSVVALHTCGWLHKNICPENILFFAARPSSGQVISASKKDFGRPIIVGYGLSRPDDIADQGRQQHAEPSRIPFKSVSRYDDANPNKESIYQHPDKATNHRRRFRHSYDMYSLGLVLLEIGLWQDLQKINTSRFKDLYEFRQLVLKRYVPDLWSQCGAIYGEVVRDCLTISTHDTALAEEGQRYHALKLAERLDKCVA